WMAQPPVPVPTPPDPAQAWSCSGVKYTCEAPGVVISETALSTTMPLVPPAADAVAAVGDAPFKMLSTANDMMQPVAAGHLICASPVMALPSTLKKMRSLFVTELLNSVIGEQTETAVVSVGPRPSVVGSMVPVSIAITHSALNV